MTVASVRQRHTSSDTRSAPNTARQAVTVRLNAGGLARIDARAQKADRTRSAMVRILLAYAEQHMPENWTPRGARS